MYRGHSDNMVYVNDVDMTPAGVGGVAGGAGGAAAAEDGLDGDENLPLAASRLAIMGRYQQSSSSSDSDSSSSSGATYQPKCSFLSYVTSTNFSTQPTTSQPPKQASKEDQHRRRLERAKKKRQAELEADVSLLVETYFNARSRRRTSAVAAPTISELKCNCQRENCAIRTFLQQRQQGTSGRSRNNLSMMSSSGTCQSGTNTMQGKEDEVLTTSLPKLPESSPPELFAAHQELIASAGGRIRVTHTYRHLKDLLECAPDFLEPSAPAGDDVSLLMLLCDQPCGKHDTVRNTRNLLHIFTVTMALFPLSGLGVSPELLFQRNYHENTALELAALSNKAEVVRYLGLLHSALGTGSRDVNDTNSAGHSVLHLLARKGDHAGDALEALLTLESGGKRVARLDVVNEGSKTPLDVANCCRSSYTQVSYHRVISLFHKTITDQVLELMSNTSSPSTSQSTPRNQF